MRDSLEKKRSRKKRRNKRKTQKFLVFFFTFGLVINDVKDTCPCRKAINYKQIKRKKEEKKKNMYIIH